MRQYHKGVTRAKRDITSQTQTNPFSSHLARCCISRRLTIWTSKRYVTVIAARNMKYTPGNGVKPRSYAIGVYVNKIATAMTRRVVIVSGRLGRLRRGLPGYCTDRSYLPG